MAGLYVHIPFCRSKCAYCDFFSTASRSAAPRMQAYCDALLREFDARAAEIAEPFETVYIGGGTPTSLPAETLTGLIAGIGERLRGFAGIREFTVEANPDDLTPELLGSLRRAGVDRISMGIQSFSDAELREVSRRHDAATAVRALNLLKESGMNYSADLIFGLPGQDLASWERSLDRLLEARPPHLSAYLLGYEPGTRLYARLMAGKVEEASEELADEMYRLLTDRTRAAGYEHYEISNYARVDGENYELRGTNYDRVIHRSVHNSNYWRDIPYLGLGVSAHSFDGRNRRSNPARIADYIAAMVAGETFCELEEETVLDRINDRLLVSLRTSDGLDLDRFARDFGAPAAARVECDAEPLLRAGLLLRAGGRLVIPERHWLRSDAVIRDLLQV